MNLRIASRQNQIDTLQASSAATGRSSKRPARRCCPANRLATSPSPKHQAGEAWSPSFPFALRTNRLQQVQVVLGDCPAFSKKRHEGGHRSAEGRLNEVLDQVSQ